jgi:branched-chain amino acid transport system substrate-binding protein
VRRPAPLLLAFAAALSAAGCQRDASSLQPENSIPIGLLLSFTGHLAANSINSERALLMAVELTNRAGGIGGRPVVVMARDTRSDPGKVTEPTRELLAAGSALFIGPDTRELAVQLRDVLADRTLILPSFTTSDTTQYKPHSWFLMGAPPARVACELYAELRAAGRERPLVIADPNGYSSYLAFELTKTYGLREVFLPANESSNQTTVLPIISARADAFVLAALPSSASSLLYTLAAIGALQDPRIWYLSPTLHTPALLETLPAGMLAGASGVATGTIAGAEDFRARFVARWQDQPLDDAYPFYDAGAVAVLAMQRALARQGSIPADLGQHIVAVTHAEGTLVRWNELDRGLALLREGQEVGYVGLSGPLEFDAIGQTTGSNTKWWTIDHKGFTDVASTSACR